ncbi:MAG: hypothetical protein OSJ74_09450, partial [Clostridia bacterium]|nr:hypothetical protein [Clostridia bacterium]
LMKKGKIDVLAKPLADGKTAICFFNHTKSAGKATFDLQKAVDDKYVAMNHKNNYTLTEQWTDKVVKTDGKIKIQLKGFESKVYII